MEEFGPYPYDDELEYFDSYEAICRSRAGTINTKHETDDISIKDDPQKKRKKIRNRVTYFVCCLMIASGILVPIIFSLVKKPPTYYVTHRSTSKPGTMTTRTRITTTTMTPFDQCGRTFVALTKKMEESVKLVTVGDLNNDNKIDIIFINENELAVYIIFNLGNNRFADHKSYLTLDKVESMTIADVNNDGNLDIILGLDSLTTFVSILLNIGNGTFNETINLPFETNGDRVNSIVTADIDDDDKCDIIIAVGYSNYVGVYFNNGNNTFDNITTYLVDEFPMSVIAADVNGDKKADIVVANAKSYTINILFNNGDGSFSDRIGFPVDTGPLFVTVGDINNDDKNDIIVVNYFSNNVVIYLNSGNNNFIRKTNISDVANPLSVLLTDFDSDGLIDIIVPNYHSNNVAVFFNDKYGTFNKSTSYETYPLPRTIATADVNDDNKSDIVVGNGFYVGVILSRCY